VISPRAIAAVLVLIAVACGPTARERMLRSTLIATNAARDAFIEIDKRRQEEILETSTSMQQFTERITKHRERRNVIVEKFEAVYQAIAAAAVLAADPDLKHLSTASTALQELLDDFPPKEQSP